MIKSCGSSDNKQYDYVKEPEKEEIVTDSDIATQNEKEPYSDEYIFSYSNSRYLTENDLKNLSKEELRIARNEIYARHGRRFNDEQLQYYFDSKSWYWGTISPEYFDDSVLNDYEEKNGELIIQYEIWMGYR